MEKSVRKNNIKLKNEFNLEIGNLLPRDYDEKGAVQNIYSAAIFDFDDFQVTSPVYLEKKAVKDNRDVVSVSRGDIVLSLISHRAVIVRSKEKFLLTPNYMKIIPHELTFPKEYFVYYFNESFEARKQVELGRQGSIISKLSIKFLREMTLFIPPNAHQIGKLYFLTLQRTALLQEREKLQLQLLKGLYQNEQKY